MAASPGQFISLQAINALKETCRIRIAITIAKMSAQPILELNGNRNRVINYSCEWTLKKVFNLHGPLALALSK